MRLRGLGSFRDSIYVLVYPGLFTSANSLEQTCPETCTFGRMPDDSEKESSTTPERKAKFTTAFIDR